MKNMKIDANGTEIRVMGDVVNEDAYISLTDIAKYKNPDNVILSILVDTFISKISLPMQPVPEIGSISGA